MPTIGKHAAEELLKPYASDFVQIVTDAWADWLSNPVARTMQHKRVRASLVWNQLVTHAKGRLDGRDGIRVQDMAPWDGGILIDNKIYLRIKKAGDDLLSRNYPTPSALAFLDQNQDLFEGIARAELVYQLDKSETEIERVAVVHRHKKSIAWVVDLLGEAPMSQEIIAFPAAPLPNGPSIAERIIKPKKQVNKNAAEGGQ